MRFERVGHRYRWLRVTELVFQVAGTDRVEDGFFWFLDGVCPEWLKVKNRAYTQMEGRGELFHLKPR